MSSITRPTLGSSLVARAPENVTLAQLGLITHSAKRPNRFLASAF